MKIYFGTNNKILENPNYGSSDVVFVSGNFEDFLKQISTQAIYLPFFLLEQFDIKSELYLSQIIEIPNELKTNFRDISFVITAPALDKQLDFIEDEAGIFFDCLLKAMQYKNIESIGIWSGFLKNNQENLYITQLYKSLLHTSLKNNK